MNALNPPSLAEQIEAQVAALEAARAAGSPSVGAHEAILRKLTAEAKAQGPLGRALALADVARAGDGDGRVGRLTRPLHVEALRPQAEFNRALVEVLQAGGAKGDWVARRLGPLADPTAWRVKSHRAELAGQVVDLTKRAYLKAAGPVLVRALTQQRAWNEAAIAVLAGTADVSALAQLTTRVERRTLPGLDPLLSRQHAFNRHVLSLLSSPAARSGDPAAMDSGLAAERSTYVRRVQAMAASLDCGADAFDRAPRAPLGHAPRRLTWFLPFFNHPFGGVHTIFRFADAWRRMHGVENTFVVYDHPHVTARELEAKVALIFPEPPGTFEILKGPDAVTHLPACDVGIATLWSGAYFLLRANARHRAYFVQDYEPLFYPAGTVSALAANTYDLGFFGLFNTQGLYDSVTALHPMQGAWFEPAVDQALFHAVGRKAGASSPVRVFFYGRPSVDRNAFELGVEALRLLKAKLGAGVEIVCAGEQWDPAAFGLEDVLENRGVLPYTETAALYRSADIGLVFMFTRHPSYLPLEMMACGVTVVTNKNPANDWLLRHGENCLLSLPTASCVAEQLLTAAQDLGLRAWISRNAAKRMAGTRWDEQTEKLWSALTAHCEARQ